MIYLDHGATSLHKPKTVTAAMVRAVRCCGNPGRGGHDAADAAAKVVYGCRERAGALFGCQPEQVVFTANCTHGLNIAIHSLVKPGARVVISGFEHNAVTRPLYALGAKVHVAGRKLFDQADTLECFEKALKAGQDAAVFTHVSNVFGYILPVAEMAALCRQYGVPFVVDAAQSAGFLPVEPESWEADFVAMPGHKGLLGPQGTGLLLCRKIPQPLLFGGTGSNSGEAAMPEFLPDRLEAGTLNVPGIAGLDAGMAYVQRLGLAHIFSRSANAAAQCAKGLADRDIAVFSGTPQTGTLSFQTRMDVEVAADKLARKGIALRAGLHCAPLAHESAGTGDRGTLRLSFGHDACSCQIWAFLQAIDSCGIR